ncbi:alpha/beta fold hydrolase [Haloarchaeobius sp. HME9146]|uniref:alpha/beta fold hydrolase n=1 Tax=Haloarchaeobius sp. HME9146 TaxID=2978732 RepID=UPI0021C0B645|nr:alpha/beta hydrolase [Haloarchaeobius sp. HME9146]MCT9096979.1 alpha/beta hydrolase [Haloarchaeobius sp. HME9146]
MPTVRTNDIETYYERRGDGPAIVFVHGSIVDSGMWDDQVAALRDEFTTVVYDVRGHGRTGGSSRDRYDMALYASDLHELVTALDLDRPVICGHSMGGLVAQAYAIEYPDEVCGLLLANTFTPTILTRSEWFLRRVAMNAFPPLVRVVGIERLERFNVWVAERFSKGVSGDYERVEMLREDGTTITTAEFGKVIRSMARAHEHPFDLSAIGVPTLILYGENEKGLVRDHARLLSDTLVDCAVDVVPGGGHASNLDNPAFFSAAVRQFANRAVGRNGETATGEDAETTTK